ncbi:META domain-containing protein [Geodermatophilus sp. SYSU D00815]
MARTAVLLVAGLLVLTACAGSPAAPQPDVLGAWELASGSAGGSPLPRPAGGTATLVFEEGQVSGRSFCNHYSGSYALDRGALTIEDLGGTEMGCDPDVMAAETAFIRALAAVDRAVLEGAELVLTGADVALRFRALASVPDRQPAGTTWVLDTLVDGPTASSTVSTAEPGTLLLAPDGSVTGSTGCKPFLGTWSVAGDVLTLVVDRDDIGCPAELGRQDEHVLAVLDSGPRWAIDGDRLTLTAPDGRALGYGAG